LTIQDRILAYLMKHPDGVDDDTLTVALGLRQRQQANQRCRRLEQFGIVLRRPIDGKIRNFLNSVSPVVIPNRQESNATCSEQPWYWEGHVQAAVVRYLESVGYRIDAIADTATREQGKDIIAVAPSDQTLWVSAKGFPRGTLRTDARTQARHWFSHALFDLILWRGEGAANALALALLEQTTYRNLVSRIGWFLMAVKR
jgi:hypothetical protein